jgi:hypothetical protein
MQGTEGKQPDGAEGLLGVGNGMVAVWMDEKTDPASRPQQRDRCP